MNQHILSIYKNSGETPLECLERVRGEHPEFKNMPMTYAGRLDPMAEGLLLVLVGDECNKKDEYLNLPKEYEVEVLFGFATDTYDLLGKIQTPSASGISPFAGGEKIQETLKNFTGKIIQKYPPFSSRTVNSKPLFKWAREGRLDEIEIPSHEVFVSDIKILKSFSITGEKLLKKIRTEVAKIKGDFRQEEILKIWEENLTPQVGLVASNKEGLWPEEFPVVTLSISCSSGTYVRAIAHDLGLFLNTPALAMKIVRTKIGDYTVDKI